MSSLLLLREVSKHRAEGRRDAVVLDRVSLEIEEGDFVGVWGPRRSGKSTLLRVMAGMERPDSGDVTFAGRSLSRMSARERAHQLRSGGIALVDSDWRPQIAGRVVDLVATACGGDGTPMVEARTRARKTLSHVGSGDCADTPANRLTVGERLRVGLAVALVREPRLLLVDEPGVLPSPPEAEELYALLRSLGAERKLAVVIASENLAALSGARRMMAVSNGEVRSMDRSGTVVPFPAATAAHMRASDAHR
jgi:predicted ABC-type transport system involved in lysophospholipase L1 biosynthesis ATPase subunit